MAETLLKDLDLVEVEYQDEEKVAHLTFYDEDAGEIREIFIRKQKYDSDKQSYHDDPEQAERAEKIAQDYFGTSFGDLTSQLNTKHDVYVYDKFCSLYHIEQIARFDLDEKGEMFPTKVASVEDNGIAILIKYLHNDEMHQTKMNYSKFFESTKKYIPNPNTKTKKLENFKNKFGIPFEEREKLVDQQIQVEVRVFGQYAYGDIKKLNADDQKKLQDMDLSSMDTAE